ncbi:hypothetical protein FBU59_000548 [Linderina macrospora]|uniref:Uncharacterized protein n=1 Tax=Linderina macrospora TaxID=4868 RepID=A0ACC1JGI2_9FUNG|nr:hypothetical protein FBU59_000548 [Linderina macrospora]
MRRIAKSFNEFKTVMPGLALLTISLISTAVVVSLGGAGHSWGRTLNGIVFTVILNLYWWMIVIKPVFGHMFMYDKCLKNFLEAVQDDGMTARRQNIPGVQKQLYNVDNSMSSGVGVKAHRPV